MNQVNVRYIHTTAHVKLVFLKYVFLVFFGRITKAQTNYGGMWGSNFVCSNNHYHISEISICHENGIYYCCFVTFPIATRWQHSIYLYVCALKHIRNLYIKTCRMLRSHLNFVMLNNKTCLECLCNVMYVYYDDSENKDI